MKIGIDGSRAFLKQRTGIEEYSYQLIKHLRNKLDEHVVVLYLRPKQVVDFDLPANWCIKTIQFPRLWTQLGLSLQLFLNPVDVLFVPAHTVPFFHPKKTIVTIHGLEYEIMSEAYSSWERFYMRLSIRRSCHWAEKIVSVSRNTKQDLINLYEIGEEKIYVVYEGYEERASKFESQIDSRSEFEDPYFLFMGRLEKRKNIEGIISAFEMFKEKTGARHKLVLGGKFGYGEVEIKDKIRKSKFKQDIILVGFVSEERKWQLFKHANVFLFPTFYEGFGIPVLEAQSIGVPVITSNCSSLLEISDGSSFLVDPNEVKMIADSIEILTNDEETRNAIIKKGYENVKRFSWEKCSDQIAVILKEA
ncbi:MAG: glycosyltransferase family 1 protein [Candidatus Moraniibacteriota bacterium]